MVNTTRLPKPLTDVWDWQMEGLCRGKSSAVFFHPDNERGPDRVRREERAKAVCLTCPVLERCRQHALDVEEPFGIWGGMTEGEREQIIAARRGRSPRRK